MVPALSLEAWLRPAAISGMAADTTDAKRGLDRETWQGEPERHKSKLNMTLLFSTVLGCVSKKHFKF